MTNGVFFCFVERIIEMVLHNSVVKISRVDTNESDLSGPQSSEVQIKEKLSKCRKKTKRMIKKAKKRIKSS